MEFRRILIAVDFRTPSLGAARWAAEIFGAHAELELAYVAPLPETPAFLRRTLPALDDARAPMLRSAHEGLRAFAATLGAMHGREPLRTHVQYGAPVVRLCELAERRGADLVVIGRGTVSTRRGRTLERLLRHQRVPVLVVGGSPQTPLRHVVAALDTAPIAERIVRAAAGVARRQGAGLTLVHVLDSSPDLGRWTEATETWLAGQARSAGLDPARVETHAALGPVMPSVLEVAQERECGLVVIGRNGQHAAGITEIGSAASLLVRASPVPVLVVPPAQRPVTPWRGRERRGLRLLSAAAGAQLRSQPLPPKPAA